MWRLVGRVDTGGAGKKIMWIKIDKWIDRQTADRQTDWQVGR